MIGGSSNRLLLPTTIWLLAAELRSLQSSSILTRQRHIPSKVSQAFKLSRSHFLKPHLAVSQGATPCGQQNRGECQTSAGSCVQTINKKKKKLGQHPAKTHAVALQLTRHVPSVANDTAQKRRCSQCLFRAPLFSLLSERYMFSC